MHSSGRYLSHARRFQALAWGDLAKTNCKYGSRPAKRCYSARTGADEKPFYVTSPIFYVNAAPHVGHLYTLVLTDVFKRWHALTGQKALLCTGTDEHGMKVQAAAKKAGQETKGFCDQTSEHFVRLAKAANVDYDRFIRTTDIDHRDAVHNFWHTLQSRGHIYQAKHEGWYSISDETFYPKSQVQRALDPATGRTFMASIETGKEVEWTSERNYHFKLSQFKDMLLEFYEKNPNFIVPESRMKEVVAIVSKGLDDLSISRPRDRLNWGIKVPNDDSQTIYVWLDALINYLTMTKYPLTIGSEGGWPADVQVIGKDIVRFHCIYWPAFLLAAGLEPPKQVLTHAHWTLGRQKMAKSTGNVVDPFFAIERFSADVMRYYLAHSGGIKDDADYENEFIIKEYNRGLKGGIGGLAARITRAKHWNVRKAVQAGSSGYLGHQAASEHLKQLDGLRDRVRQRFKALDSGAALREIMESVHEANRFITAMEPWRDSGAWSTSKEDNPLNFKEVRLHYTIFALTESLRICGLLLQPFMPEKSAQLLDLLGVDPNRRMCTDENLAVGSDEDYGTPLVSVRGENRILFPPIPDA